MIFSGNDGRRSSFKVINISKNAVLAKNAKRADNFFQRLIGLMGKPGLGAGSALILKPCTSIHTFFMRFPIDVAFVDRQNRIIKIYLSLRPWRLTNLFINAAFCLELPAGTLTTTDTQEGDFLKITNSP